MFREIRRSKQALDEKTCVEILKRGRYGVLAVDGDDHYPYAVPLGYNYEDGAIFFHGAPVGHRIDAIERNDKVSFCVVDHEEFSQEEYTTHYRSVIVFGRITKITADEDRLEAVRKLTDRYASGDDRHHREMLIQKDYKSVGMLRLDIEHMSGKERTK